MTATEAPSKETLDSIRTRAAISQMRSVNRRLAKRRKTTLLQDVGGMVGLASITIGLLYAAHLAGMDWR